jgi:hypothetical protein
MKNNKLKNIIRKALIEAEERTPRCCGNGHCDAGCKGKPCEKGQRYCPKSDYPSEDDRKTRQEAASGKCKYVCENGATVSGNCCSDGTACEGNRIKVCAGKRFKTKNENKMKKYTKRGLLEFIKSTINTLSEEKETNAEYCAKQKCTSYLYGCPTPCDCPDSLADGGSPCEYNGPNPNGLYKAPDTRGDSTRGGKAKGKLVREQNWTSNMWSTGNYQDYHNWFENFYTNVLGRNNPCNFLNNQIGHWTTQSQNVNPNSPTALQWTGQMSSKISSAKEICCDLGCPCC